MATTSVIIHTDDETTITASRVPAKYRVTDFVSVNLGGQASVLLFNVAQAKAFADAALRACIILQTIEDDKFVAEFEFLMDPALD